MAKSKPWLLDRGLGGRWAGQVGAAPRPGRIIPFDIDEMGAIVVQEAGCEGLKSSVGQQGHPSVDGRLCYRMLEETERLSCSCVCELDKSRCFSLHLCPVSVSCFYATTTSRHGRLCTSLRYVRISFLINSNRHRLIHRNMTTSVLNAKDQISNTSPPRMGIFVDVCFDVFWRGIM